MLSAYYFILATVASILFFLSVVFDKKNKKTLKWICYIGMYFELLLFA